MSRKLFELTVLVVIVVLGLVSLSVSAVNNDDDFLGETNNVNFLDETFRMTILRGEENLQRLGMKNIDDIYQKKLFTRSSLQNIRNINEIRANYLHYSNPFVPNSNERNVKHATFGDYNLHVLFKCRNVETPIQMRNSMESLLESGKVSHLAKNIFSMRASLENVKELLSNENIEWIGQIDPIFKFHIGEFHDQELLETHSQEESTDSSNSRPDLAIKFISMAILLEQGQKIEQLTEQLRRFTQSINNGQLAISKIVENTESITITVRKDHALAIAYEIAKHSSVLWIEPLHSNYEMNKFSKRIINYGSDTALEQGKTYFNGLTGKDEVITVVDGTFDTLSCFFYDPNAPVEQIRTLNDSNMNLSSKHRKVKMHFGLIDFNSNDYDHGTHVAATVAGYSSIPELYEYRGMAYESKLALVQLGCATPGGCTCETIPGCACKSYANELCPPRRGATYQPLEPHKSVHKFTYEMMNSRIQTNSWGGGSSYNLYAMYTDRYIWDHKDMIVLFSAGNSGTDGFKTIGAQAQTKNGLAVGASHNSFEARKENELSFKSPASLEEIRKEILASLNCTISVEECAFFRSDFNVCSTDGFCSRSNASYASGNCGCAAGSTGDKFCGACVFNSLNNRGLQINSVATFSSRGPTPDLRIKPDVTAPGGDVLSARSYSSTRYPTRLTCKDTYKSPVDAIRGARGTSMSTPVSAGLIALIRQYYREGYFPSRRKQATDAFIPSSALLKASIINSGTDLQTVSDDYLTYFKINPRTEIGSFYQGFGRVQLDQVLSFEASPRTLQIARVKHIQNRDRSFNRLMGSKNVTTEFGDPVIDSIRSYHYYFLKPFDEKKKITNVKITLVWVDYPGSPSSSSQLVNDLDLFVRSGNDQVYGNSQLKESYDDATKAKGGERDFRNNVEQVWIDENNGSGIAIKITANYLFRPQSYALVVTGENIQMIESNTGIPTDSLSHASISHLSLVLILLIGAILSIL